MTSHLGRGVINVLFAFIFLRIGALAEANGDVFTPVVEAGEDSTSDVFMTPADKASKLPRINPTYLGKVDKSGSLVGGTKSCLYDHEKQENIIRAVVERSKGQPTKRILRRIRRAIGRRRFRAWKKYTFAMKELGRNRKCGLVWNKASGLYSACCVFRVGMNDSAGQLSCLAPWSVGHREPSPESKIRPKFGLHYGFSDVDGSLPPGERRSLRNEMERYSGSPRGFGFVKEEGKFQTEMLGDLMVKAHTETPEELAKGVLDHVLEKEVDRLRLTKCQNMTGRDMEVYGNIQRGLSNDIRRATACLARAQENAGPKQQPLAGFESIALKCQHTLSAVLGLHREAIFKLAITCMRCADGKCTTGSTRGATYQDPIGGTIGIWELNFFDQTWTWNFDYGALVTRSSAAPMSAETSMPQQGAASVPGSRSSGRCTRPETAYYSLCCDSVLALSRLCQQLHDNSP